MSMKKPLSNSRRFTHAGYMTLIAHNPDGSDSTDPKDVYTSGRVVMGVLNSSYNTTQTPLEDENSLFPAANYTIASKSTVSVEFNTQDERLQAYLKGAEERDAEDVATWYTNIERTVQGSGSPVDGGEIVLASEDGSALVIGTGRPVLVRDQFTNEDYKQVAATPKKSEFAVDPDTATFTFAKEDVGKTVFISCELVAEEARVYEMAAKPKVRSYTLILSGPSQDHNEVDSRWVTETYDRVQVSGDVNSLVRSKTPGKWTATFETGKPRPGRKAVTTVYADELLDIGAFNG